MKERGSVDVFGGCEMLYVIDFNCNISLCKYLDERTTTHVNECNQS